MNTSIPVSSPLRRIVTVAVVVFACGMTLVQPSYAEPPAQGDWFEPGIPPISAAELNTLRGGYESGNGFDFSFGISVMKSVNNEPLVTQTLLQLDNIVAAITNGSLLPRTEDVSSPGGINFLDTKIDTPPTSPAQIPGNVPIVIQRGNGNYIDPKLVNSSVNGAMATFIQNSLDNQNLVNAQVYDLDIRGVLPTIRSVAKNIDVSALQHQLIQSRR